MRDLSGPRVRNLAEEFRPDIHEHRPPTLHADELEKRIPLAAQTSDCAELEELQELLHFPEEVALRLADTEYQLFYKVHPVQYVRQVALELRGASGTSADNLPGISTSSSAQQLSVPHLIKRFNE
ncbi:PREDICTED: uncharacterized protein LOC108560238, partial [Nicrophorus vespilloides]|uniref:Uncharacterized protein LOC108560238 n=1 Tax=Nicrophorus vespilloides TaxID=110193 RepID=A0ABM1MF37_NICVS